MLKLFHNGLLVLFTSCSLSLFISCSENSLPPSKNNPKPTLQTQEPVAFETNDPQTYAVEIENSISPPPETLYAKPSTESSNNTNTQQNDVPNNYTTKIEKQVINSNSTVVQQLPNTSKPKEVIQTNLNKTSSDEKHVQNSQQEEILENKPDQNSLQEKITDPEKIFNDQLENFFQEFVNEDGTVKYKKLKRQRLKLYDYLAIFENFNPQTYKTFTENSKIAFWINAYNINILKIIIENYPIESTTISRLWWPPTSIRHIDGIWDKYKFKVMGEVFTLSELEQRFFIDTFKEPRVFLAISRASLGGPPLNKIPYSGKILNKQLEMQAKKFFKNKKALKINRQNQSVAINALLQKNTFGKYFVKDYDTDKKFKEFDQTTRSVLNFISKHIRPNDALFLETGIYQVKYIPYDWRLNE